MMQSKNNKRDEKFHSSNEILSISWAFWAFNKSLKWPTNSWRQSLAPCFDFRCCLGCPRMQKVKKVMLPRAKVVQNNPNGLTFFEFWKSIKVKRFLFSIEVLLHSVSSKKAQHWFEPSFFASKCYFLTVTHQKTMKLDPKNNF